MLKRNPTFSNLSGNYLFQEIAKRKNDYLKKHPEAKLLNLGIGDTTMPLRPRIAEAMSRYADGLKTVEGYSGYGTSEGWESLRSAIAKTLYAGKVDANDVFVSDGAKCDIGRLQMLFSQVRSFAVQDPTYPVYVQGSLLNGIRPDAIHTMPCLPERDFMPDLSALSPVELIYLCSPNNPTGACLTRTQLQELVAYAKEKGALIIYDSAYSFYIQDPLLPKSIYEIEGAEEVAIESGSFSKMAGFTGVRLGWTVVPAALKYGSGESVRADWVRLISTVFNGASNSAQAGGLACLTEEGQRELAEAAKETLKGSRAMKEQLQELGYEVYGGVNAPYLWVRIPGRKSWEVFDDLLERAEIISVPGVGFGPAGEGFVRFSAFAGKETLLSACRRLAKESLIKI
ncbi:MAG: LL-diaminopimelate aminotransferase [Chlamydiia bacterium]|nr:LL-diaminopimelate aminotransferase [Chlamydiia bacterium]